MPKIPDYLTQAPVFSKLNERARDDLLALATEMKYNRDEYAGWQGRVWPYMAYIASGRLERVLLSPEGLRQMVLTRRTCDFVWGHSVVDGRPMPASLEVREDPQNLPGGSE